jgi:hypothetical protein
MFSATGHGHATKAHHAHKDHKENSWLLFGDFVGFVSFVPRTSGRDRQQSFDVQQI